MLRKIAGAAAIMVVCVSFAVAEEFGALITKVDGGKVTFFKTKKGQKEGDAVTLPTKDSVKVVNAKFNKDTKKIEAGDAVDGGLKASLFTKIGDKGVNARVVTDDDGKNITEIRVFQTKKKKDAN